MPKLFKFPNLINILKYGTATILLVIPLYPKFPILNVPGIYVAIRAEDFIILFLSVVWFLQTFKRDKSTFFKDKINIAIMLFLLAGLLSSISSLLITKSTSLHIVLLHWARRVEYLLPFFIARTTLTDGLNKSRFFVTTLFLGIFLVFAFGYGQVHFGFPVISTQNEEYSKGIALRWTPGARLHSTFAGHYDLAAFLVMLLPIATALLFFYKKLRNRILFFLIAIFPGFWLMLKAESRVSFLSFLFGIIVVLWLLKKRLLIIPTLFICIVSALLFSNLGVRYKNSLQTYWQRVTKTQTINFLPIPLALAADTNSTDRTRSKRLEEQEPLLPSIFEDRSTAIRLNVEWPRALRAFVKNPLLGTGYSSITLATDNDYLRLLGETGLVGTLAFFLIILRLFEKLVGFFKRQAGKWDTTYLIGFTGALLGILLNATFIDVFEASKVAIIFWTLAGTAIGTIERKEKG